MSYGFDISREEVERLKADYPNGTEIILEDMQGESRMPKGLKGVVDHVDDIGQVHVKWENGSTLALIPRVDRYKKIETQDKERG